MRASRPSRRVPRSIEDRKDEEIGAEEVRLVLLKEYARRVRAGLPLFDVSEEQALNQAAGTAAAVEP
jgi:hypothetical protein